MITMIMSCLSTSLSAAQRRALEARVKWVVVNTRSGRAMLDVVGERADLQWVFDRLVAAGKDPITIAAFNFETGQRIKAVPLNLAAYLAVAPDIVDSTNMQAPVFSRPTTYAMRHKYMGWPDHDEVEEP